MSAYLLLFKRELTDLAGKAAAPDRFEPETPGDEPVPLSPWITAVHIGFMAWTVMTAHYPALFVGGFLVFLGFAKATSEYQSRIELKGPLLVGFFLAGLVIHGGLQAWWIAPVLEPARRTASVPGRDGADRVQRQRDDHLSRDARAEPQRIAESGGR